MNIETQFNINQAVWLMHENKPIVQIVREIQFSPISKDNPQTLIKYGVSGSHEYNNIEHTLNASQCYITKEELLKSL